MKDCIFCKIAEREIHSEIIFEDDENLAFLDISPTTNGMALVTPKKHHTSDLYANSPEIIASVMETARKTAILLSQKLQCERVLTGVEGLEVDHLHIKLYPLYIGKSVYDTLTGNNFEKPTPEELKILADRIRS